MIERVARALCRLDGHPENAKMDGKPLWQDYVAEARAAIAAMRDPTETMLDGGLRAPNYLEDQASKRGCANIYRAMIDAALAEQPNRV